MGEQEVPMPDAPQTQQTVSIPIPTQWLVPILGGFGALMGFGSMYRTADIEAQFAARSDAMEQQIQARIQAQVTAQLQADVLELRTQVAEVNEKLADIRAGFESLQEDR